MNVAIIGCGAGAWDKESVVWVQRRIEEVLRKDKPSRVITGPIVKGGVNSLVVDLSIMANIPYVKVSSRGRAQGMSIALQCERLIAIVARNYREGYKGPRIPCQHCLKEGVDQHIRNDVCWTLQYAQTLERQTQLIVVGR